MIPRVVYQTWYNIDSLPTWLRKIHQANRQMNPALQFILLDDRDIDRFWIEHASSLPSLNIKKAYYRINPKYGACRADIFRYAILYVFGGIYMDIKIQCRQPFQNWVSFDHDIGVFSYWQNLSTQKQFLQNQFGELQNWFLIFQKNDPLLKKVLLSISDLILKESKLNYHGKEPVLYFTGPLIYTSIIEPLLRPPYRLIESWKVLDYGDFSHASLYDFHYSRLKDPLFLKLNLQIPYHSIHMNDTTPVLSAGLYLFFETSRSLFYQIQYPLHYLCQGIDFLIGYHPSILFYGSVYSFPKKDIMNLYQSDTTERIFLSKSNHLIKVISIQLDSHQFHLQFHHQTFISLSLE